jgi:prophage tail gpP-like protein
LIWKANQGTLRSSNPNLIYPGEVLQIPGDPSVTEIAGGAGSADIAIKGKDKNEFTLIIDKQEIPVMAGRVMRTMDTVVDGWTAVVSRDIDIKPFKYNRAQVYLGGRLVNDGVVYMLNAMSNGTQRTLELEGFSATADIVDSTIRPPYEAKKITLQKRATDVIEGMGLSVVYDVSDNDFFEQVTARPSETIFAHLAKLAKQRRVLISSTVQSELRFYRAELSKTTGALEEGQPPLRSISATFDARKRYSSYRVIGNTSKRTKKKNALDAVAVDSSIPRSRFKTIELSNASAASIKKSAEWLRSTAVASTLTITVPVDRWYAPCGDLWTEGKIVTLISETIFVPDGFDFLIKNVEYNFSNEGTTATLSLVPPQVFIGGEIEEPWSQ